MLPLIAKAVVYELLAMLLVFLVSWAWTGSARQSAGLTLILFLTLTAYYYAFHRAWPAD